MKNTKLKCKTIKGKVIWKIDFYRVLKRSYSIFIRKAMFGGGCIDARIRAHYLPLTLSNYIDEVYCFSIAPLSEFSVDEFFVVLACPSSNFASILKNTLSIQSYTVYAKSNFCYKISHSDLITKESVDFCETRLKSIKHNKKNKKYINLTQHFLTDPSFLFVAYNQIKSKFNGVIRGVDFGTLNKINSG